MSATSFFGGPHVVRTDFRDDEAWLVIRSEMMKETADGFRAYVDGVEDGAFAEADPKTVMAALPPDYPHSFLVIVDADSMSLPDRPVLVIDLLDPARGRFRAVPSAVQQIENNLSIANMDFAEFAGSVDSSGLFRGF